MTALAAGASVTVSVRDGGTVAIATNGGSASALVAPTEGGSLSVGIGPLPERRTLGPYAEGASIVLTNANCGSFDYDVETRFDPSSVAITGGVIGGAPVAGIAQVSAPWPTPYTYTGGRSASSLLNTRRALAAAQASILNGSGVGAARSSFLCIGDSTVFGLHSGSNGLFVRRNAWPAYLAKILSQQGYGGISSGIFGDGLGGNLNGGDDRLSAGSGWSSAGPVFAQNCWQQSASGGALTWTPDAAVDTVDVYYLTFSGLGTFTVDNGAAAFITQNTAAVTAATVAKVSATITSSANPINIKWASGGAVKILGIRAYSAATTGVDVINAGANGQTTAGWIAAGAYSYSAQIANLAPACTFISLGFNDLNTAYPLASYQSGLQSLATGAQNGGTGDVVFLIQHPQKITSHSIAAQKAYWDAANAAAATVGACAVNLPGRWVTGEAQSAMLFDDTHPNAVGGFDIAKAVADVILGW